MKEDNNEFFQKDKKLLGGAEENSPTQPADSGESILSRRVFIGRVGKIVALGAFVHLKLLGSKAFAADDTCHYGTPDEGDVCGIDNTDECPDGQEANDTCTESSAAAEDVCHSGEDPEDKCKDGGTPDEGDACWGGGGETNGNEQDNCEGGAGDICTSPVGGGGGGGHDNCGGDPADKCDEGAVNTEDNCGIIPIIDWSDDTCYNGTNVGPGENGGDDYCTGGIAGTDACHDGSTAQDLCDGADNNYGNGDVCFSSTTDDCELKPGDEDYCPGGQPENGEDQCPGGGSDKDNCPGGTPAVDDCPDGTPEKDNCPGGDPSVDSCPGGGAAKDNCPSGAEPEDECDPYAEVPD